MGSGDVFEGASGGREYCARGKGSCRVARHFAAAVFVGALRRFSRTGEAACSYARETRTRASRRCNGFKSCAGGFFDIDYIVAYLKLSRGLVGGTESLRSAPMKDIGALPASGQAGPELQGGPANSLAQIAFLESRGALDREQASALRDAANFYRSLDHAIRLVLG